MAPESANTSSGETPSPVSSSTLNAPSSSNRSSENAVKCSCVGSRSKNDSFSGTLSSQSNSPSPRSGTASLDVYPAKRICCLKQRFSSIFNCEHSSDVVFIVRQGEQEEKIYAHKLVLSVGSPVFHTMFNKNWSTGSTEIEIPDIKPLAFTDLLRFIYMDEVSLCCDTVDAVLYAARKYAVQPLENLCVDFLIENLSPENAFKVLKQGMLLDIPQLTDSSLESIDENTDIAVTSDEFCNIDIDALCMILSRDTLTIGSEIQLFKALLRWAKAECRRKNQPFNIINQRVVLQKAIPLIRFPLMTAQEFSSKVAPSGLLVEKELLAAVLYLTTKPRPSTNFNTTHRLSGRELIMDRFSGSRGKCLCTSNFCDTINFTSDHDLELVGYGLHSSLNGAAKYQVRLRLFDTLTKLHLRDESADFISDSASMTYRAAFREPIKLTALQMYSARVHVTGPDCFYGTGGMEKVSKEMLHGQKVTITFSTSSSQQSNPFTSVEKGLIPQLIFKV